jgi:predicted nucleotidyltransferase
VTAPYRRTGVTRNNVLIQQQAGIGKGLQWRGWPGRPLPRIPLPQGLTPNRLVAGALPRTDGHLGSMAAAIWHNPYGSVGSLARGEARPDSDVDLCVSLDPPNPFCLGHFKQEVEQALQVPVDVISLWDRMNPALRRRIDQEGVFF